MTLPILVGSNCEHFNNFNEFSSLNDVDFIVHDKESLSSLSNINHCDKIVSEELYNIVIKLNHTIHKDFIALTNDSLYTLKLSHMGFDINWGKHFIQLKQKHGYCIINYPVFIELHKFWEKYYNNKNSIRLNKTSKEFFNQSFNQEHDELHEFFKLHDEPIYKKFLKDNEDILPDKQKFYDLDYQLMIDSVIEETMVTSYERKTPLKHGFKHLITKLSKGWWNRFCIINLFEIMKRLEEIDPIFKQKVNQLNKENNYVH